MKAQLQVDISVCCEGNKHFPPSYSLITRKLYYISRIPISYFRGIFPGGNDRTIAVLVRLATGYPGIGQHCIGQPTYKVGVIIPRAYPKCLTGTNHTPAGINRHQLICKHRSRTTYIFLAAAAAAAITPPAPRSLSTHPPQQT